MANSIGEWFKRYWVWISLVGLILLSFIVYLLFFTGEKGAGKVLKEAEEAVNKMKEAKAEELKAIDAEMEAKITELVEIKTISDEEERLKRLAEFANRRKKS